MVTPAMHGAIDHGITRFADRRFSSADAVMAGVMLREMVRHASAFDRDFVVAGSELLVQV